MKTKGKNRKVEKKNNFEKKIILKKKRKKTKKKRKKRKVRKKKEKKKRKVLWITVVIYNAFGCRKIVIPPHHLEYVVIYIYVYKKLYS